MGLFGYFGYQVFWAKGLLLNLFSVRIVKLGFEKYSEERFSFGSGSNSVILGNSDTLDSTSDILDKISNNYNDSDKNLIYFELLWIFRIKLSGYFRILKKQNKLCYSGCSSKHGVEGTGHSSASPWSSLFILGHILGSSVGNNG
ncbi:hypothetical protein YC2023_006430 [Brassica napus]